MNFVLMKDKIIKKMENKHIMTIYEPYSGDSEPTENEYATWFKDSHENLRRGIKKYGFDSEFMKEYHALCAMLNFHNLSKFFKKWNVVENNKIFPKLLVLGNMRHGKDTLAELLRDNFGLDFVSSSQAASDILIFDRLKEQYGYTTPEECFEDRINHRAEWYDLICDYNKEDKARLAKGILERADCYVGMRDRGEIDECMRQELFDLIIWVDASERLPLESPDSFNIDKTCADIVIENNGTFEEFKEKVNRLGLILSK